LNSLLGVDGASTIVQHRVQVRRGRSYGYGLMYKHKNRHRSVFILQTGSAECVEENIPGLHSSI
jgi:mRNA-degrading endonuclease RelE of RelBE toxin-antitoxin system